MDTVKEQAPPPQIPASQTAPDAAQAGDSAAKSKANEVPK